MTQTAPTTSRPPSPQSKPTSNAADFVVMDHSHRLMADPAKEPSAIAEEMPADPVSFRNLSRDVFGAEASREYIKEAICFGWISGVAVWSVGVMVHQLATMMISPPPGGIW